MGWLAAKGKQTGQRQSTFGEELTCVQAGEPVVHLLPDLEQPLRPMPPPLGDVFERDPRDSDPHQISNHAPGPDVLDPGKPVEPTMCNQHHIRRGSL